MELLAKAILFCRTQHHLQTTKSGEPYSSHPLAVTGYSFDYDKNGMYEAQSVEELCARLLHDVCEDCVVSIETMHKMFGSKVATIVDALTKPKGVSQEYYLERLIDFENAAAIRSKLADIAHNRDPKRLAKIENEQTRNRLIEKYDKATTVLLNHYSPFLWDEKMGKYVCAKSIYLFTFDMDYDNDLGIIIPHVDVFDIATNEHLGSIAKDIRDEISLLYSEEKLFDYMDSLGI